MTNWLTIMSILEGFMVLIADIPFWAGIKVLSFIDIG